MILAGGQRDFGAEVRGFDFEAGELVMLGPRVVHGVLVDDVGLAGFDARGKKPDPERAGGDGFLDRLVPGAQQCPFGIRLDGAHEGVGDEDAVMEVQRLAVRIAAGRAAHFHEFLDLGMIDRQVDRRRAATQRALADGEGERIHHADEGNDARGFAVAADRLADGAQVAPIGADAAALGGEPDILVPQADNAVEAVAGFVQKARNGQAALRAAIGQDRRRGHEPEPGNVVVETLGMAGIALVGIEGGDAGKHILVGFSGHQIAVAQCRLAELGEQRIAAMIDLHARAAIHLNGLIARTELHFRFGRPAHFAARAAYRPFARDDG